MNTDPEVLKIKIARKRILAFLNIMYGTPLQLHMIYDQSLCYVDPAYDFTLFKKDILYLKEKGYIEFVDDKIGGATEFKKKVAKLTTEGKEIAERTRTDRALEI